MKTVFEQIYFVFQHRVDEATNKKSSSLVIYNQNKSKVNGKVNSTYVHSSSLPSKTGGSDLNPRPKRSYPTSTCSSLTSSNQKNCRSEKNADCELNELRSLNALIPPNGLLIRNQLVAPSAKRSSSPERLSSLSASTCSQHPREERLLSFSSGKESYIKLRLAMSSADAFKSARSGAKGEAKFANVKKKYYQKAIALMVIGGLIFSTGIVFAVLHFAGYITEIRIVGPICLAIGLLMIICGIVWLPIIKTKLKRQESVMSRTFSL